MNAFMEIARKAKDWLNLQAQTEQAPEPEPTLDDYIQAANMVRRLLGMPLIDPATKEIPGSGEPVTMEAMMRAIEPWEMEIPGTEARFRRMAQLECHNRLRNEMSARQDLAAL